MDRKCMIRRGIMGDEESGKGEGVCVARERVNER